MSLLIELEACVLKIVPIVEGDGEVTAVPVLLKKLLSEIGRYDIQIAPPKNAHGRANLQKAEGLEKFVKHAWKERDCGAIVILLDAENECPVDVARDFSNRIIAMGVIHTVVIVCAARMYETWFLASLETIIGKDLNGRPGLTKEKSLPAIIESINSPKSWLNDCLPIGRAYKETQDQEPLTQLLDVSLVRERSRSFRRLCQALNEALAAIDNGSKIVTPFFSDSTPELTTRSSLSAVGKKKKKYNRNNK